MEMPGIFSFSIGRSSEGLDEFAYDFRGDDGIRGKGVGQRYLMKPGRTSAAPQMIHGNVKIIYDPMQEFRFKYRILHGVHDQVVSPGTGFLPKSMGKTW